MRLTPELYSRVQRMNPRELRATALQALDDHQRLTSDIEHLKDLQEMHDLQLTLLNRIHSPVLTRLGELMSMAPRIMETRTQLLARKDEIEQVLWAQIESILAAEFGQTVPADPFEAAMREQRIGIRRGEIAGGIQSPQLSDIRAQLAEIKKLDDEYDRVVTELEQRLREALSGLQTRHTAIHLQHVTQIFAAVRNHRPQEVAQRLDEMRQELRETDEISRGLEEVRGKTPLITIAQDVIGETQSMLAVGAGNQLSDLQRSAGLSGELTDLVRSIPRLPSTDPLMRIAQDSLLAQILHAGNCDEHAAVAFTLLWKRLGGQMITCYANHTVHHSWVVIGDPRNPDTAVVCDPWPRQAEAVPLRDFFVQHGNLDASNVRVSAIADGRDLVALVRDTVHVEAAEARMEEERAPLSEGEASQRWGGRENVYQHDSTRH